MKSVMCLFVLSLIACSEPESSVPLDRDQDGYRDDVDCDDLDADAFPGANEYCDGRDNDCDGAIDGVDAWGVRAYYQDDDGDGFGVAVQMACEQPVGYARVGGDCNDADPSQAPGQPESCNGRDDDCNGIIDDAPVYADADGDGFGVEVAALIGCDQPGSSQVSGDCDDHQPTVFPGGVERCDGLDNDCDGWIDDEDPDRVGAPTWFPDADEDGFGVADFSLVACDPGVGWSDQVGDCAEFDARIHPGAPEWCDGIDQDCDGVIDGPGTPYALGASMAITVTATESNPLFIEPIDLEATTGSITGDRMVAAFGDCEQGFEAMPTRGFIDAALLGLDGGALVLDYQGDLQGSRSGRLYLDADPIDSHDELELVFAEGVVQAATRSGLLLFDQLQIRSGVHTPSGLLALDGPIDSVFDAHPSFAIWRHGGESSNPSGHIGWTTEWAAIQGRVYTRTVITTLDETRLATTPGPISWLALQPAEPFVHGSNPVQFGDLTVQSLLGPASTTFYDLPDRVRLGSEGSAIVPANTLLVDGVALLGRDHPDDPARTVHFGSAP